MSDPLGPILRPGQAPGAPELPFDEAVAGAAAAASPGLAFLAGYRAALRALVPDLPPGARVCLCASEEGGAHPRAIATRLVPAAGGGFRLSGRKQWVTGGTQAERLLVVASTGIDPAGRNRLRVASVAAGAAGVRIEPLPPAPFVPDVPHAAVQLEEVVVPAGALLEGDGYERYLKPFRTVEDIHVHGALLAWLLARGRRAGWPEGPLEEGCALLAALRELARREPLAATTHVAVAGALSLGQALLDRSRPEWARLEPDDRAALERDVALLQVAAGARGRRREAAWGALRGLSAGAP